MHKVAVIAAFRFLGLMVGLVALLVAPGAALAQATINVPRDQPTIQAGIDSANDGDTVLVAPGKYVENIDFMGKAITVTSSGGATQTVIDGGGIGPVVTFGTSETPAAVLSGMTIQNGGGYGTNPTAYGIAGVVVSSSSPTIQNNIITQNQCWDIEVIYGAPLIQGNTISSTQTPVGGCGVGGSGAGIYVFGNLSDTASALDRTGAVIQGNTIENITISATLEASQMFTNLNSENGGAGIAVLAGGPTIENNIIRNNSAPGGNGGGINIAGGSGTSIAQNLIYGNSAGCGGGAISFTGTYTGSQTDLLVANNTIADNTGGSADPYSSCGNVSQIYSVNFGFSSPNVVFVNNIVSGNSAAPAVGCYSTPAAPSEAEQSIFDHNLLYNAGGNIFGPTCVDVSAKYGNVAAAPQFANPAQANYHLLQGSPGIDTGNNSALQNISNFSGTPLATDFDGNPRVQDATRVGYPIIDMGAYEQKGTVDGSPTTIVLVPSAYSGNPGDSILFTASIRSSLGVPTGSVAFFLDGQQVGTGAIYPPGFAVFRTVFPGAGTHSLYAAYLGAGSFTPARSVVIILIGAQTPASKTYTTSLELGANINPQTYGKDVTFTIIGSSNDPSSSFSPSPITLAVNQAVLASVTLNREGLVRYSTDTLPVGSDVITASYAGDATHQASTASTQVSIQGSTPISLYCSPFTITVGQTASLNANVNASGGYVFFEDNGATLGETPVLNGVATWNYLGQTVGEHSISAFYPLYGSNPRSAYATCSVPPPPSYIFPGIVVVGLPSTSALSVQPATGAYLSTTTMTATVSPTSPPGLGTPTGAVNFMNGTTLLGTANLAGGVATLDTILLPAGVNLLTCQYQGDSTYAPSNCNTLPITRSVAQPVLTISASADDIPALTPVTFTVTLSATGQPVPTQPFVVVSAGGQTHPVSLDAKGTARAVVSNLLPGTYPVTATFSGNASLLAASASLTETVVESPSTTVLTASPNPAYSGEPVTIAAMVTAQYTLVPEGATVTFYDGSTVLGTGTLDQTRTATLKTSSLAVGTHALTASYPGTNVFLGSTSAEYDETILASSFTIALSPSTVSVPVDQTATVAIQLSSIGSFAGPLTLSYGSLPANATARILPSSVMLTAGGEGQSMLVLNTYTKTTTAKDHGRPGGVGGWTAVVASALVFLLPRRRKLVGIRATGRGSLRLFLWVALLVCMLQAATGCGNSFYTLPGVAPGSYPIQVTATDVNQRSQTAVLTLNVTPRM